MLLLVAVVALYALPANTAEECAVRDDGWTCVERFEAGVAVTGDFAEIDRDSRGESADAEEDTSGSGRPYEISRGELLVGEDEWPHDLMTSTKWSFDLIEASAEENLVVVTYTSSQPSPAAPRVLSFPTSRIQVLDVDREEVVLDVEFPDEISNGEWTDADELVVVSDDGALTVFAQR